MSFTVGYQFDGEFALIAVCDFCGEVVGAERDEDYQCVLPDGWTRVGKREEVGEILGILQYRSMLKCSGCLEGEVEAVLGAVGDIDGLIVIDVF